MFKFLFVCYNVTVSNNLLGKTHGVGKDVMLNSGASCETELFSSECDIRAMVRAALLPSVNLIANYA